MKTIELTQGQFALVDDNDWPLLIKSQWCAIHKNNIWYAIRVDKHQMVYMHREITGCPKEKLVDHKDGNGLNNCRSNLRVCTKAENVRNQRIRQGTSKYKGVSLVRKVNRWKAAIGFQGGQLYLGMYATEAEAAIAYNQMAVQLHGEFARLNPIENQQF